LTASASDRFDSLGPLGWDGALEEAFTANAGVDGRPARVSRVDRRLCTVLGPGVSRAESLGYQVATGDWVVVRPGPAPSDRDLVAAVLPRRTAFVRDRSGPETAAQVIAANVDRALLICGLDVDLNAARLERYLTLAWQSGATPVVLLAKRDLCSPEVTASGISWARGIAPGVDVRAISSATGEGVQELAEAHLVEGRTVAMLGPSGVGKSSLVNALAGNQLMPTGATRRDGKGRHTTTHGELLVVRGLGVLLDTPGLRGLGLWDAAEGLSLAFEDIEELAGTCRFSDCGHAAEPGCGVQQALADGRLGEERYRSWRKLQRELKSLAARQGDLKLRQEAQRRWKAISRESRRHPR
jgi:ribosome biogenesis GTPase / thiamine phosphate phosphatase